MLASLASVGIYMHPFRLKPLRSRGAAGDGGGCTHPFSVHRISALVLSTLHNLVICALDFVGMYRCTPTVY